MLTLQLAPSCVTSTTARGVAVAMEIRASGSSDKVQAVTTVKPPSHLIIDPPGTLFMLRVETFCLGAKQGKQRQTSYPRFCVKILQTLLHAAEPSGILVSVLLQQPVLGRRYTYITTGTRRLSLSCPCCPCADLPSPHDHSPRWLASAEKFLENSVCV